MSQVPDHPTIGRWCKGCNEFRPIKEFIASRRSFECRVHNAIARKIRRAKMLATNPARNEIWYLWHTAYTDSRRVFIEARDKWCLTQDTIKIFCAENNIKISADVRVVPRIASEPIAKENMVVVSRSMRTLLAKVWRSSKDELLYRAALETQTLSTGVWVPISNANVGL
jgi:hypothetical protein